MCGRGYSVTLKSIPSYIVSLKSLTSGFEYTGLLDKERVRNSKDIFFIIKLTLMNVHLIISLNTLYFLPQTTTSKF